MNNLLVSLRNARSGWSQKLAASFIESPHEFELDMASVAVPLKQLSHALDFIPDESLPPDIRDAAITRKLNFIGGRLCAESALERIGFAEAIVQRDTSGVPIWPVGTVGSITHTDQFAYAAVSRTALAGNIGIDSEHVFSDCVLKDVRNLCCTGNENLTLFNSANRNVIGTIVFSAKESLYKAIYSTVKRFVDFSEIEITGIDWYLSKISLRSVRECDLSPLLSSCYAYFCISNEAKQITVHTSVQLKPVVN